MKTLNFSGLIICAVRRPPHLSAPTRNNKLSVACHRAASAGAFSMNIIFSVRHTICCCLHLYTASLHFLLLPAHWQRSQDTLMLSTNNADMQDEEKLP